MNAQNIGWLGELRAAAYLKRQGMLVIVRRYRAAHGEIDLIARDGDTLVFVEVKSRPRGRLDDGFRAVNAEKRRHVRAAAYQYLETHPFHGPVRFDAIEICAAGLRHRKNAF